MYEQSPSIHGNINNKTGCSKDQRLFKVEWPKVIFTKLLRKIKSTLERVLKCGKDIYIYIYIYGNIFDYSDVQEKHINNKN